jgi:hypothetical protein
LEGNNWSIFPVRCKNIDQILLTDKTKNNHRYYYFYYHSSLLAITTSPLSHSCQAAAATAKLAAAEDAALLPSCRRRGASLGGSQSNVFNPTLRLFSHTCLHISRTRLHTTSDDDQTRRHKKHKQTNTITMVVEPLASPAAWI